MAYQGSLTGRQGELLLCGKRSSPLLEFGFIPFLYLSVSEKNDLLPQLPLHIYITYMCILAYTCMFLTKDIRQYTYVHLTIYSPIVGSLTSFSCPK